MVRSRWPLWPLLSSCGFHALLLMLPVALVPLANSLGTSASGRLDVRLIQESSGQQPLWTDAPLPGAAAELPPDAAPQREAPAPMPPQPPLALVVPNRYFLSAEVDQKAEPIAVAPLIYPEDAYLRRIPGSVTLRVYLNETGAIDGVDILAADPPGMFDQAALDAVLATRFRPALLLARPVKNVKTIEIRFDPLIDR